MPETDSYCYLGVAHPRKTGRITYIIRYYLRVDNEN